MADEHIPIGSECYNPARNEGVYRQRARRARARKVFQGLTREELLQVHRLPCCCPASLDDKEIQLKHQSRIFFPDQRRGPRSDSGRGRHGAQTGYDWFYPYYRDRALCLKLGVTPLEMLLAAVGARDDPSSHGRQMPSHWGEKKLNIVSGSSPTGTQVLQAVGAAEASRYYSRVREVPDRENDFHPDEIVFTSLGEGASSEGEFWEAVSGACLRQLPVCF